MQGLNLNPTIIPSNKVDLSTSPGNVQSVGEQISTSFGELLNGQITPQRTSSGKVTHSQTNAEAGEQQPLSVQDQTGNIKLLIKQASTLLEGLKNRSGALTPDQERIIGHLNTLLQKLSEPTSGQTLISGKEKNLLKNLESSLTKRTNQNSGSDSPNPELTSLLLTLHHLFSIQQAVGQAQVPGRAASSNSSTNNSNLSGNLLTLVSTQVDRGLKLMQGKDDIEGSHLKGATSHLSPSTNSKIDALSGLRNPKPSGVTGLSLNNQTDHDQNQAQDSKTNASPLVNTVFVGGRDMGKVQQLVFFSQQNPKPSVSTPADQMANQIKQLLSQGAFKNGNGQMTVQLNLHPNSLGAVQLTITQTDSGLSASILAHSERTKDLIKSQLTHLEQSLAASGISVQKLDVNLAASTGQNANDQAYQQPSYEQPQQQHEQGSSSYRSYSPQERDEEDLFDQETFENWLQEVNGR